MPLLVHIVCGSEDMESIQDIDYESKENAKKKKIKNAVINTGKIVRVKHSHGNGRFCNFPNTDKLQIISVIHKK